MNQTVTAPPRFWTDNTWRMKNHTLLQARYKEQWVAIVDEKVVAHGDDPVKLREEARKKTGVEKDILIDFIEGDSHIY